MASLQVQDIDEEWDSGRGTSGDMTRISVAFTDDMSIVTSGLRSVVSDECQVRKG